MTLRIIHTGSEPECVPDDPAFIDTTIAVPRKPQRTYIKASDRLALLSPPRPKAKRYGPVTFLDRAKDQCAWIEAGGLACGLQTVRGSWCKFHDDEAHGR